MPVYKSVKEISLDSVDLVISFVLAKFTLDELRDCAEKNLKGVIL